MIYFLRSPGGPIKIGTTIRLAGRLRQLAAEHGEGLEVLAVVDGSFAEEGELHRRFAHLRRVGEWFEPGDDLLGFIVAEGRPWSRAGDDEPLPSRPPALNIKGDLAWRDWVERAAAHSKMGVSDYIELALARTAKAEGFPEEPPERLP